MRRHLYDRAEEFALAQAFHRKSLEMGRSREEFVLPTKGGGRLPVVVSVRALYGPERGRFAIVTLTDISDQKRTQEKLRTANARLEELSERNRARPGAGDPSAAEPGTQSPFLWGGLRVDTFYHPARRIGGDFGLVAPVEEQLNLLVCDVSGHGISSALVANRIYSETLTLLGNRAPLADMLRQLNSLVIQNVGAAGFFFTLAAARIDRGGRTMEFAGAGHPPAMIVQPGAEPRLLPSRSTVLGTLPDAVDADATLYAELEHGDRIVLYTDGLTDVFDSRGEMLKVEGVRKLRSRNGASAIQRNEAGYSQSRRCVARWPADRRRVTRARRSMLNTHSRDFEFPGQNLRNLSRIDPQLLHPREQRGPLKSQAGRGALRTPDASLGLSQNSHNPILFVEVSRSCRRPSSRCCLPIPVHRSRACCCASGSLHVPQDSEAHERFRANANLQLPQGCRRDIFDSLLHAARVLLAEVSHQQGNVFRALAQGRNANGKNIEPVVEIASKLPFFNHPIQTHDWSQRSAECRLSSSVCFPDVRILRPAKRAEALAGVPAEYHRLRPETTCLDQPVPVGQSSE